MQTYFSFELYLHILHKENSKNTEWTLDEEACFPIELKWIPDNLIESKWVCLSYSIEISFDFSFARQTNGIFLCEYNIWEEIRGKFLAVDVFHSRAKLVK